MAGILRLSSIEVGQSAVIRGLRVFHRFGGVCVAVINPTGKMKPSRLPDKPNDVEFVLADGRRAYFPIFIADKFREAGVQARVPFEITRSGVHQVSIRNLAAERLAERDYHDARDYSPEPEEPENRPVQNRRAVRPPEQTAPHRFEEKTRTTDAHSLAPAAATPLDYSPNGSANEAPKQAVTPLSTKFMGAYKAAIDILLESQVYAKHQGLLMEVHCEDVRCLAATIMIGTQR